MILCACFEALLSKQRRQVSQVPQMSFPSNLRQLRGQMVSMPAFFHSVSIEAEVDEYVLRVRHLCRHRRDSRDDPDRHLGQNVCDFHQAVDGFVEEIATAVPAQVSCLVLHALTRDARRGSLRVALDRVIHTHLLGEARRPGGAALGEVARVDADLRRLARLGDGQVHAPACYLVVGKDGLFLVQVVQVRGGFLVKWSNGHG